MYHILHHTLGDVPGTSLTPSHLSLHVLPTEELESAIAQHKCSLELLELQEMLYWPPLQQICPESYIPPVTLLSLLICVRVCTCVCVWVLFVYRC